MVSRQLSLAVVSAALCLSAFGANIHPGLPEVKRVYLLPMSGGLDQYLANSLTKVGRFEVVTDPANADAVFTDRLGPAFEEKWEELYPPPPAPEARPADAKAPAVADPKAKGAPGSVIDDLAAPPVARISSFARGRGNVFLVSRKSGAVIWSHYRLPKSGQARELDHTADAIADRLHADLQVKK